MNEPSTIKQEPEVEGRQDDAKVRTRAVHLPNRAQNVNLTPPAASRASNRYAGWLARSHLRFAPS